MQILVIQNNFIKAVFLDYGAILHELWVTSESGQTINVIQGLANLEDYREDEWCRGALIGRFAGRLTESYSIDGTVFPLYHTDGVLLHSGDSGWGKQFWKLEHHTQKELTFSHICQARNSGFPGTVKGQISYELKGKELHLEYKATTNSSTHINLTNHAYFNLNPTGKIDGHELQINASKYLELAENLVPNGTLIDTNQTPMDFRQTRTIDNQRLDDYFVLDKQFTTAASLYSAETGIGMQTITDQPGVVVFTPPHFEAICFETQKFSNSPNLSHFPTTRVDPNETYSQITRFQFSGIQLK